MPCGRAKGMTSQLAQIRQRRTMRWKCQMMETHAQVIILLAFACLSTTIYMYIYVSRCWLTNGDC